MQDAIAVIRSQGERTEGLCLDLVSQQFDTVVVVRRSPFFEAVRECMRIGMRSGRTWLVTIDADVLISPTYWQDIEPEIHGHDTWQVLGCMDDKLSGGIREGGVRLWRIDRLRSLVGAVRDVVRPEADLCDRFPGWLQVPVITGRHDFEQYYRDLHRKGASHRRKHPKWTSHVERAWRDAPDHDLQAAYAGWHGQPLTFTEKAPL